MKFLRSAGSFFQKADMILLALCVAASIFGAVMVDSTTSHLGGSRYLYIQLLAIALGVVIYAVLTLVDIEILADEICNGEWPEPQEAPAHMPETVKTYAKGRAAFYLEK